LPSQNEIERRYKNIRSRMATAGVDALIICGNQYAGFEGAVFYASGFEIVHRYVYLLLPLEDEPTLVFPREARWIGDKAKPWVKNQVWPDVPGRWICERAAERKWKRVGVYGMNFIMAVRDYRELAQASLELVPFDFEFDMARAVKSEEELAEVRDAMDIIIEGFWALVDSYQPGKTEAEIMAPAVERFFARGAGPRMMNIVLSDRMAKRKRISRYPAIAWLQPAIFSYIPSRSPGRAGIGWSSLAPCCAGTRVRPRRKCPRLTQRHYRRHES